MMMISTILMILLMTMILKTDDEDVDIILGDAFHYKGTYATLAALNAALSDSTITSVSIGDIYNIANSEGTDVNGTPISAGDNVIARQVTGKVAPYIVEWAILSAVDPDIYCNDIEIDDNLNTKIDNVNEKEFED